tara:strand:- start:1752 stop:1916 length:165 start_codon:yes stop_codon:yes gene_type:complete
MKRMFGFSDAIEKVMEKVRMIDTIINLIALNSAMLRYSLFFLYSIFLRISSLGR